MRIRVKICGITNEADAAEAVEAGADALGFIFVPDTPRYVGANAGLAALLDRLPPFVSRVAVCMEPGQVPGGLRARFDAVQVYDAEVAPEGVQRFLRAFRVKDASSLEEIGRAVERWGSRLSAAQLDTYHKEKLGGSGETFNWELAIEAKARFGLPIVLAGGLTPENVAEAITTVRPYAIDVSSGVEAEPGRKDHAKLRAFLQAARSA